MNRSFTRVFARFIRRFQQNGRADMVRSKVSGNKRRRHICAGIIFAESLCNNGTIKPWRSRSFHRQKKLLGDRCAACRNSLCVSESIRLVRSECDRHSQVTLDKYIINTERERERERERESYKCLYSNWLRFISALFRLVISVVHRFDVTLREKFHDAFFGELKTI